MTKGTTTKRPGSTTRTIVTTKQKTTTKTVVRLTASEEKVVRMSRGMKAEGDLELEPKTRHPDLLAQLRDIEARLFIEAGEIGALSKKSKIIQKLKPR